MPTLRSLVLAALILMSAAPSALACTLGNYALEPRLGDWDHSLRFYLEASGESTGAKLGPSPNSAAVRYFKVGEPTTGVARRADQQNGLLQIPAVFESKQALDREYFLNLSKPLWGKIYLSSEHQSTAKSDNYVARFEVFLDGRVLFGRDVFGGTTNSGVESLVYPCGRPETRVLPKGGIVSIRITFVAGNSNLWIGTGGDSQSFIEFRYLDVDPLTMNLYRDGNRLQMAQSMEPTDAPGSQPGFFLFALLGLTVVAAPRRRRALLLAALLLSGALAGCMGGRHGTSSAPTDGSADPASTVEERVRTNETLRQAGRGALIARVVDAERNDFPLAGVHATLVGTSFFTITGPSGAFRFDNITAGTYTFRVDRDGFVSLERDITIKIGDELELLIRLVRPVNNLRPHAHGGDWGDDVIKKDYYTATTTICNPDKFGGQCLSAIPIDGTKPMLPGTVRADVTLTWDDSNGNAPDLGIQVMTTANRSFSYFDPRPPGTPFQVHFFPHEADPGHQKMTMWEFRLMTGRPATIQARTPAKDITVEVNIDIYKGVVPLEPEHKDRWGPNTTIQLLSAKQVFGNACFHPTGHPDGEFEYPNNACGAWVPLAGTFVPVGTKEVRGTLTWSRDVAAVPEPEKWTIVFKSARYPGTLYRPDYVQPPTTTTPNGTQGLDFTIDLSTEEGKTWVDQFYQTYSYWKFFVDDTSDQAQVGTALSWKLTAVAVKDPAFKLA